MTTPSRPLSSYFTPSLTDFFFLILLFWLFLADPTGWERLLWDGDTALHTRVGDYILDNGQVPKTDPFSFTLPGERWFAFQWGTGLIFALLNRWAGLKGIVLLCGIIIALYQVIVARDMVRRGANGLIAILLVMLGCNAAAIHYHARPHLFTLLFLACGNYLIARDREAPSWRLWLMLPMMVAWANLHSGFPVMIALMGILAGGAFLHQDWPKVKRYGTLVVLSAGVTLLNPNGIALYQHISKFLNNKWAMDNINEYQSPVFRSEAMYYFMAILFVAMMVCAKHFAKKEWTECGWILFMGMGSLVSARHVPLFVITVLPLIGVALTELWVELTKGQSRKAALGVLREMSDKATGVLQPISIWAAVGLAAILFFTNADRYPKDLSDKYFPRDVVRRYAGALASNRVFTTDQWGDYLLWVNYPKQRNFMDGRSDFFQEKVGADYLTISEGKPGWREALKRYAVDIVLVPPGTPLIELLEGEGHWSVLHRDKASVLLTRLENGLKSGM